MHAFGVLAHFEVKPGNEAEVAEFFRQGRLIVERQPPTTMWFAFRIGPTAYGAFAAFETSEDRDALLASGGPRSSREHADLFAQPPTFEKVDLLQTRVPPQRD